MKLYAMTGGATGIGAALRQQLQRAGHEVISIDIQEGDIIADLSTSSGRDSALAAVRARAADGLDGFIACAGLPPVAASRTIAAVNYFGAVDLATGLQDLLGKRRGTVLLVSSNSAPMTETSHPLVQAFLAGDEAAALAVAEAEQGQTVYSGSKCALVLWMRRNVVAWAKAGVRVNAVAPGITLTPLTEQVFKDPQFGDAMREFSASVPWGEAAQPDQIANVMRFMLSDEADFVCGSVFFVDGGSDAMLRSDGF
ncbi:SDR family oxidoreductase [Haliea sp. E1-2-M8]|uniref:SDR family oxidoreductase n=1 Tax=Haliea sp. E1-2-M8 TaxID=3064706 RepID=UPI002718211B|nr:SDR family oxidoreductase [Haliea sp. E1-2-M8]MDO8861459.1 SDR family oxidoreductase [Haliea sp. E1-2-M8]